MVDGITGGVYSPGYEVAAVAAHETEPNMNAKTHADIFAAIATIATDAVGDWESEGNATGAEHAQRVADAAEACDLDAVREANDSGAMVLGGPVMHIEGNRAIAALVALVAADDALADAVEAFNDCDDDDDEEIADARADVLAAAYAASIEARKRAHGVLGWDALVG